MARDPFPSTGTLGSESTGINWTHPGPVGDVLLPESDNTIKNGTLKVGLGRGGSIISGVLSAD
jgi:hypothetical protein